MKLPERINANWIDAQSDEDLLSAEGDLHKSFTKQDKAERTRRGAEYQLLRGPESLTGAWMRWSMVSNAVRLRGLRVRDRR
ncbi:MAG TPA: hypothetical protein VEA99_11580 [Gemmatimonadaceae bacterium]|nr:hypothetical protein [Gemmatimonadaceae bacterium]